MKPLGMKTEPDLDTRSCDCGALRQASRHITQIYDRHLAAAGMTTTQFGLLARLKRHGALSLGKLAEQMVMDRTTLNRVLKPLQRDGLVESSAGEDGRRRLLGLTKQGAAKVEEGAPHWRAAQTEFETAFGPAEAAALRAALARAVAVET